MRPGKEEEGLEVHHHTSERRETRVVQHRHPSRKGFENEADLSELIAFATNIPRDFVL